MKSPSCFVPIHFTLCWIFAVAAMPFNSIAQEPERANAEPAPQPHILAQKRIDLGGRTLILNRVAPMALPKKPAEPPAAKPLSEAEQQAEIRRAEKKVEVLFLTAAVHEDGVSELRPMSEAAGGRAFSNIDFRYFTGVGEIETDETVYTLLLGVEAVAGDKEPAEKAAKDQARSVPALSEFSTARSEYRVDESAPLPEATLHALDALHVYFDARKAALIKGYQEREAARLERERILKEHPPAPADAVVNYWFEGGGATVASPRKGDRP